MYNKFTENDTIKSTETGSIKFPVSSNIELWDNDEKRSYENLNRPIRNLFENSMETQFILDKIQDGIKMNADAVLTGCELVVSESLDEKRYVSLTPGLFFYDDVSYSIYPTPSIASRQLEKDLELETEDGIDFIKITYEGGKFKASISITKSLNLLEETTTNEFDRGIDLLNDIEAKIIASDSSLAPKFDSLENYALEPCFVIPTTGTRYVNFNPSSKEIVLEETSNSLNFGFVDNFVATDNKNSRWVGLVTDSYKDDSVTNAKLADMAEDTLKGNNAVPGDPKDLGKEDVVAMFNLVTMDSPQTIDGTKTFIADQIIINTKKLKFKGATSSTDWNVHSLSDSKFEISENATPVISIIKGGGSVTVTNPVALSDTLTVSGVSTLNNSLEVDATGAEELIDLKGPTTITGVTLIKGGLTIGEISSEKTMTVIDPITLSNTLAVSGVSTLNNSLTVNASGADKKIDFNGPTTITGETIVKGGDLAINGNAITTDETTTFNLLNTTATATLNFANTTTTINMGELANIKIGKTENIDKAFTVANKTASTNSITGALVVSGGVGIGGNVFTDGNLTTTGKITSAGLQSTVTDTDTSLEVATSGVNTIGNVKSTISSAKKFSIEKDTTGNLLSVKHDGITANVAVSATENITSTKTITGKNFVSNGRRTGGTLYEVSDINSLKFNDYTIENTKNGNLTETDRANANLSLLWVDGAEQGELIKKTPFSNFPVAYLNSDGTTGKNGLMSKDNLIRIKNLESAAGFTETGTPVGNFLYTVNDKGSIEGTNGTVIYSNDIKLKDASVLHTDGTNESTESIYDMFRTLRDEKVRVKGHLPAGIVNTTTFGQIIKKAKNGTAVAWGQITDDEIATTLTKVSPSNSDNLTDDVDREIAFWSTSKNSLIHDTDITYNTSSNTLIAETVSSRSSRKLKKDIELYEKSAFDTIDKIDIVSYHFIADETQTDRVGFIAEDSPELVSGKDRDHMEMNNCIGLLLKAVQELKQENAELRSLINDKNS